MDVKIRLQVERVENTGQCILLCLHTNTRVFLQYQSKIGAAHTYSTVLVL